MTNKFKEIKERLSILDVLNHYNVQLDNRDMTNCPIPGHEDKNPSFSVKGEKFKCFSCDSHGDVIELIQKIENGSKQEALEIAFQIASLDFSYNNYKEVSFFERAKKFDSDKVTYFKKRGITIPVPTTFKFEENTYWGKGENKVPAILAPYQCNTEKENGKCIGYHAIFLNDSLTGKYHTSPKQIRTITKSNLGGACVQLQSKIDDTLSLTEGIETGLAVKQAIKEPVWCATTATNLANVRIPKSVKKVEIWADNDKAGVTNAKKLSDNLLKENKKLQVTIFTPENEGEDWLDVLNNEGEEKLHEARENAYKGLKPSIYYSELSTPQICEIVAQELRKSKDYFIKDKLLVKLWDNKLELVTPNQAVGQFESLIDFKRAFKNKADEPYRLSSNSTKPILESTELREYLPEVLYVVNHPVLLQKGESLELCTDYDTDSKLLITNKLTSIVERNTAIGLIIGLLEDFKFKSPSDKSRAIASILSPALLYSGLLGKNKRVPATYVQADKSQSGKGYLCQLIASIYNNHSLATIVDNGGLANNRGGLKENLDHRLIEGCSMILIDNVRNRLEHTFLESFLTARNYQVRALNRNSVSVDPTYVNLYITSNGTCMTSDLANRLNMVNILKQDSDYELQGVYGVEAQTFAEGNQQILIGAVFTVLREWHKAGCPKEKVKHDFKEWAGSVEWIIKNIFEMPSIEDGLDLLKTEAIADNSEWINSLSGIDGNDWLRGQDILEYCLANGLDVPVIEDSDFFSEQQKSRASAEITKCFNSLFKSTDTLEFEDFFIEKQVKEIKRKNGNKSKASFFKFINKGGK